MCFLSVCDSEIDSLHEIDSDSEIGSLLFCFVLLCFARYQLHRADAAVAVFEANAMT